MADIIPFPNPVSSASANLRDLPVAGTAYSDPEIDKMLQARARIQQVLDDLSRINDELQNQVISDGPRDDAVLLG